jgi:acyl carrier protein
MTQDDILAGLTRILRDLLGDDSIVLERGTVREDVPGWDSFNYVNFIVATEMEFAVKFKVADVESFPNVGAIADRIEALRGGAKSRS